MQSKKTYIFIDESGDTGFKFNKGSGKYFVVSAVAFDDHGEMKMIEHAIVELKNTLGFQEDVEFKFNKSSNRTRIKFLNKIRGYRFKVYALIIDKIKIYKNNDIDNKYSFYINSVKILLEYSGIINARIRIDGSGSTIFKRKFRSIIRKNLNTVDKKVVDDITFVDSKNNTFIQIADMIAGSIRKSYEGNSEMKNIIKNHIYIEKLLP